MKNNVFFILIAVLASFCFLSCNSEKTTEDNYKGYRINGTLFAANSDVIYLIDENNTKIDSSKITNNSFLLKGFIKEVSVNNLQLKNERKTYPIILENSNYTVSIDKDKTIILGGNLNTDLTDFNIKKDSLNAKKLATLNLFMKDEISSTELTKKVDSINDENKNLIINFITKNEDNLLSINLINTITNFTLEDLKKLKTTIKSSKNINLQSQLSTKITDLQKVIDDELAKKEQIVAARKSYRKAATMFSGDGLNGNLVSLQSIMKGKKAVLIDFWASWCGPCRVVTPTIKRIYNKYRKKGFTILTVSEDRNKNAWQNGVAEDGMLSWNHIYDDFGRISSMYGVRSIPYMVLIDGNGGIIKEKISINELEYELQKIFN